MTADYVIPAGTVEIPAGGTVDHGDVALTCSDAEACTVTVADDGAVTSLGGTVTAANSALYAENLEVARIAAEAAEADRVTAAQRAAISSAIAAANAAVGVVTDAATDEVVAAADMAIAAAKMAIADAANVPAEEAAANSGTVSVLETALANTKTSRTAAIAAAIDAEAVRLAAEAVRLAAEAAEAEAAKNAVVTKAVGTKAKAIGGVKPDNMPLDDVDVKVTATRAGPEIKVEGDDDFTHAMGPMYSLKSDADDDENVVQEIVLVDHTITAPKRTSFAKVHEPDVNTDTTNDPAVGDETYEALDLGGILDSTTMQIMQRCWTGSCRMTSQPARPRRRVRIPSTRRTTDDMVDAAEVVGTYDGAPGTYRCDGADDCTVTLKRDAKGKFSITGMTDGWIFTPDAGAKGLRGGHGVHVLWCLAQADHGRGRRADLQHG